ncbi:MAG TPA: alpha/beta hydrolase [Gaiellaceae bacterium]|nr:alpha/beta hydrolase [Gaiellaceae bacterium]
MAIDRTVVDRGEGIAVVFTHGTLMDHTMFAPQIEALQDRYRVIAYNHRGRTNRWAEPYDLGDLANDCRHVLGERGIEKCVLGGMSMGGFMAFEFARMWPERLHGLILIDTKAAPFDLRQQENVLRDYGKADTEGLLPHDVAEVAVARCFGVTTIERNPRLVAQWVARWRKLPARSVYNEVRSWLGKADNRPELANIDVPTLILHGEEDSIFPMSVAEEIKAGIPRARLVPIPLAGHTANLEQPNVSNEAIVDFLRSTFGGH